MQWLPRFPDSRISRRRRKAYRHYQPIAERLEWRRVLAAAFAEFVDPNPVSQFSDSSQFGHTVLPLSNGNVVVSAPFADVMGSDSGAVYLFNGATGALISTLTGGQSHDQIGVDGIFEVGNGNFVVVSRSWSDPSEPSFTDRGAVTFVNGVTGLNGAVSSANSLVGSTPGDVLARGGVTVLPNGNYVVVSDRMDIGALADAGAVTWGDGSTGVSGEVSAANSLVGNSAFDRIGIDGVTPLPNGNFLVASSNWANGGNARAGAVTWVDGSTGMVGPVDATNSLVGTSSDDRVGADAITVLSNGNYVVRSDEWNNGAASDAGAVTWGDGASGVIGAVSDTNSLIGSTSFDAVGTGGVFALANGNYVVSSFRWTNNGESEAGAATWGDGTTGVSGAVSASNSLVGVLERDQVGVNIYPLTNGNYVVESRNWGGSTFTGLGAVTWGDGTTGVAGTINAANSLIGASSQDEVGSGGVTPLANGNYVVSSPDWNNFEGTSAAGSAGAATWADGTQGIVGLISSTNSLVGTTSSDEVSSAGVVALPNGNYVVQSRRWNNGSASEAGAVTWGDGTNGTTGNVSSANSLVGSSAMDQVGGLIGVVPLANSNYVVVSQEWNNGTVASAGAVTWGDGSSGVSGEISSGNSLIGTRAMDRVGNGLVTPLPDGNYVVISERWSNGAAAEAGAVTLGNGFVGTTGTVSPSNSLVGSQDEDFVGSGGVIALADGDFVVVSGSWNDGASVDTGAVTWIDASKGTSGPVSRANSLLLSTNFSRVVPLDNGNYLVNSAAFDAGTIMNAGVVVFGNGQVGEVGSVDHADSVIGSRAESNLQNFVVDNVNGHFYAPFIGSDRVVVGSQTTGFREGTILPRLIGDTLRIADGVGDDDTWQISYDATNLVIKADIGTFQSTLSEATLTNNDRTLMIPLSHLASLSLSAAAGDDAISLIGSGFTDASYHSTNNQLGEVTLSVSEAGETVVAELSGLESLSATNLRTFAVDGSLPVHDQALDIDALAMVSLGHLTTISGGTLAANAGVALPVGSLLTGNGTVDAPVSAATGSMIELTGNLSLGDTSRFDGFFSDGLLQIGIHTATLLDRDIAVLGSLTSIGDPGVADGMLNADNGFLLEQGKTLEGQGTVNNASGPFVNQGFVQGDGDGIEFNGLVTGGGDFGGTFTFNGGTSFGNSPAEISIDGNATFGSSNTHTVEIGGLLPGSEFDRVEIGQAVILGGTLEVKLISLDNGYIPAAGDSFEVMNYASKSGQFDEVTFPNLPNGLRWRADVTNTAVTLVIIENGVPTAADDTAQTPESTPVAIDVLENDTDPDNDSLQISSVTNPSFGDLVVNGDNTITYTPLEHFHGEDSFEYTIDDGFGGQDTATVTIAVLDDGQPSLQWQNSANRFDVDNNGNVNITDALGVVSYLRQFGIGELQVPISIANQPPPFVDVNGDDDATLLDALDIVARLRQLQSGGEGEAAAAELISTNRQTKAADDLADVIADDPLCEAKANDIDRLMATYASES